MKAIYWLCLCLIAALFSRCSTLVHGPLQKFVVTSDPRVASVYVDGKHYGKTPVVIRMARKKDHILLLRLAGYQPYELRLKRKVDGWIFGNVLTGGLPGVAIDYLTGSIYRLTPKDIYPTLTINNTTGNNEVALLITMHPDPSWEKIGKLKLPEVSIAAR